MIRTDGTLRLVGMWVAVALALGGLPLLVQGRGPAGTGRYGDRGRGAEQLPLSRRPVAAGQWALERLRRAWGPLGAVRSPLQGSLQVELSSGERSAAISQAGAALRVRGFRRAGPLLWRLGMAAVTLQEMPESDLRAAVCPPLPYPECGVGGGD